MRYRLLKRPRWQRPTLDRETGSVRQRRLRAVVEFDFDGMLLREDFIVGINDESEEEITTPLGRYVLSDGRIVMPDDLTEEDWPLIQRRRLRVDGDAVAHRELHRVIRSHIPKLRAMAIGSKADRTSRYQRGLEGQEVRNPALHREADGGKWINPLDAGGGIG